MNEEPCTFLDWDSQHFGINIARVNGVEVDELSLARIFDWCREKKIDCLYFLVSADDPKSVRLVEDNGFRLTEIRVYLERSLVDFDPSIYHPLKEDIVVREAKETDIPALQTIAKNSYNKSRFYFDSRFPEEKCQAYYQAWIKNCYAGLTDVVLVAEAENEIQGFITDRIDKETGIGYIDLLGVREDVRKAGVGHTLGISAMNWLKINGAKSVIAVTQGRNIATQRLCQRDGLITRSCQLYYHKWFN